MKATSNILYVRASLGPLARKIKAIGGVRAYLSDKLAFEEILAPHFYRNRFFWQAPPKLKQTNSGALGKQLAKEKEAVISTHPTHAFVGFGDRVTDVLADHDHTKSCFYPVSQLAESHDFSMLLLGCVDSSPGFSTVHATQYQLGLSQRHMLRFAMRWDYQIGEKQASKRPLEFPGCSKSFDKFYDAYERAGILVSGEFDKVPFLFVKSAREAMALEHAILERRPRFVSCDKSFCASCHVRLY